MKWWKKGLLWIIPGSTLVVFDEIQDCPRAIQALKYFCENLPELHIIAAGSLLGVALREEGISFPVGKVERIHMYPMSFEEFVRADGGGKYIDGVRKVAFERELTELYTVPLEKYLKKTEIISKLSLVDPAKNKNGGDLYEIRRFVREIMEARG